MHDVLLESLRNLARLGGGPISTGPAHEPNAASPPETYSPGAEAALPHDGQAIAAPSVSREVAFQRTRSAFDNLIALAPEAADGEADHDAALYATGWAEPPANWSDSVFCAHDAAFTEAFGRSGMATAYSVANFAGSEAHGLLPDQELMTCLRNKCGLGAWVGEQISELAMAGAPILPNRSLADRIFWAPGINAQASRLRHLLRHALPNDATHVILAPWLDSGGAELLVLWHARVVDAVGGRTIVLGTDASKNGWANQLPKTSCYVNIPDLLARASLEGQFAADDIADGLALALSDIPMQTLHIINSYIGYRLLRSRHAWTDLRIFVSLFGVGHDDLGLEAGYWFEARNLKGVDLFLTDNKHLPATRGAGFGLEQDRLHPIHYPTDATLKHRVAKRRVAAQKTRILWASRLDAEKLPNLVFDIARRMPDIEFHMFGRPVLNDCPLSNPPANVALRGPFDGWKSLPDEPFDCFLFTSRWEGMPNIILEAMGSGLPIVSSRVGAIPEALGPRRGWLVDDVLNANAYVEALGAVLQDPDEAERRSNLAIMNIIVERSFDSLLRQLREIGYV